MVRAGCPVKVCRDVSYMTVRVGYFTMKARTSLVYQGYTGMTEKTIVLGDLCRKNKNSLIRCRHYNVMISAV
jgi:hypothetical protein